MDDIWLDVLLIDRLKLIIPYLGRCLLVLPKFSLIWEENAVDSLFGLRLLPPIERTEILATTASDIFHERSCELVF